MRDGGAEAVHQDQNGGDASTFQTLHTTIQDGLSLEFVAATAGRECNIQDTRGGGLNFPVKNV